LTKELKQKGTEIEELKGNITSLENKLNDLYMKMKHKEEKQEEQS
jgi:predicted transcriptional regulator